MMMMMMATRNVVIIVIMYLVPELYLARKAISLLNVMTEADYVSPLLFPPELDTTE